MKPDPSNGLVEGPAHLLAWIVRISALGGKALLAGVERAMGRLQISDGQIQVTLSGGDRTVPHLGTINYSVTVVGA